MKQGVIDVTLQPGEHFIGDERHRVHTLLGSCVSITLWQPQLRIGAMSHFLLAGRSRKAQDVLDARYGGEAMDLMLRDLAHRGVAGQACEARIFGGASMFPGQANPMEVGRRNGEAAHRLLENLGIEVVGECLYGHRHRRIRFDIATGEVWAQRSDDAVSIAISEARS